MSRRQQARAMVSMLCRDWKIRVKSRDLRDERPWSLPGIVSNGGFYGRLRRG